MLETHIETYLAISQPVEDKLRSKMWPFFFIANINESIALQNRKAYIKVVLSPSYGEASYCVYNACLIKIKMSDKEKKGNIKVL